MKLKITNFSCIKNAEIEIKSFTVIIGPQASGKSLISKLIYFFNSIKEDHIEIIKEEKDINFFQEEIRYKFCKWFPISAWGESQFFIKFESNDYKISINRVKRNDVINDTLQVRLSDEIKTIHKIALEQYKKFNIDIKSRNFGDDIYEKIKIQRYAEHELSTILKKSFKNDFIDTLTYIPAGRSFFTNLGRALLAFEQTNLLDPVTIEFAKLYTGLIQNINLVRQQLEDSGSSSFIKNIIGGSLVTEKNNFFIKYNDGRKIPFSSLSSGQQELMPLLLVFTSISRNIRPTFSKNNTTKSYLTFIEEPEAHLFPDAQSKIIEGLVTHVNSAVTDRRIFVTTHSPYVLSKLNNLLKAGHLQKTIKNVEKRNKIETIIKKSKRLDPSKFGAYALINGSLKSIVDKNMLIDAEYLDEISNEISNEFSDLLNIEFDLD